MFVVQEEFGSLDDGPNTMNSPMTAIRHPTTTPTTCFQPNVPPPKEAVPLLKTPSTGTVPAVVVPLTPT